jgi:hypothetical protein
MKKTFAGALLLAGLAAAAVAALPEGKGTVALGLDAAQASTVDTLGGPGAGYYYGQTGYGLSLKGDAPLWSGIALGLDVEGATRSYEMNISGFAPKSSESIAAYGFGADLRLYPAAFLGHAFKVGDGANPDGWLLWPSLNLGYSYARSNDFNHGWFFAPIDEDFNVFTTDQDFSYEVVLPMATGFSVRAGYQRNSVEDITENSPFSSNSSASGGAHEGEWLGLSSFIDLAPGAGADAARPFVPHLGRVGTLRADLGYQRRLQFPGNLYPNWDVTQTLNLALSTPLSSSLGLGLSVARAESDLVGGISGEFLDRGQSQGRVTWQYGLALSWAFGDPAKRVD